MYTTQYVAVANVLPKMTSFHHRHHFSLPKTIRNPKIHALHYMSTQGAPSTTSNKNIDLNSSTRKTIPMSPRLPTATTSPEYQHRKFWTEYFLNYVPDEATETQWQQEVNKLKEEVRKELLETIANKPILEQLEFIDNIQRLGVGYHFEQEIEDALGRIYDLHKHDVDHDLDLHHASLRFRLLRRHGYYLPCEIFKKFLNEEGCFKSSLSNDVEGMLQLYEASHLRVHGEDILEEALSFTASKLKSMSSQLAHHLTIKVTHALEQPLHKGVGRLEARHYISTYELDPSHNKMLLKFAKLDFNVLQSIHKKELAELTRWWYELDCFTRLPNNVTEILFEMYFSALGTMDERPKYFVGRIITYKVMVIGTMIDDHYDVCDISHIELLTKAIMSWDKACIKELPDNLKLAYAKLLDTLEEIERYLAEEGRSHNFQYALDAFKILWDHHLQTTKWYREGHIPPFDEFMRISLPTTGLQFLTVIACLGLEPEIATREVFDWILQDPKPIQALSKTYRLQDDIADDPKDNVAGQIKPTAVTCYMKQHNIIHKEQAFEGLGKLLDDAWKDINQSFFRPTKMPMPVLERILTQARYLHVMYKYGDGYSYSHQAPMKSILAPLFKDPIPI